MKSLTKFIIFLVFSQLSLLIPTNGDKIACRDENGEPVDWYYLYKLPSSHKKTNGLKYLYLTSNSQEGWKLSNKLISSSNSFPARTISSVFNDSKILSVAYNDEIPNGKVNFINGHTKGVVAANENSGFWLIHSVPKYPQIDSYTYPQSGKRYGQSFLCVTFEQSQINQIAKQLIFNEPNIYQINIPDKLKNLYPNFTDVSEKKWRTDGPYWNQITLISAAGTKFQSFAKGRNFNKELYEDWIAPKLNSDLLVETWRNGGGNFPSNCTRLRHVFNVAKVEIKEIKLSFKSNDDHSKWTVGVRNPKNKNENWICVGDINRQKHQLRRGGGTMCQLNAKVAETYRNLVKSYNPCSS